MNKTIRALIVEDLDDDARLLVAELKRGGYDVISERVDTAAAMRAALLQKSWDVILCDFTMPYFNGAAALQLAKESGADVPFIYVSGTIGEDVAIEAMKSGSQDYVMKTNLARLAPAIERELHEARVRRESRLADAAMRESEHKYRHLFEALSDAVFLIDEESGRIIDTNTRAERLLGRTRTEIVGSNQLQIFAPQFESSGFAALRAAASGDHPGGCELKVLHAAGHPVPVQASASRIELYGRPLLLTLLHDVFERNRMEAQLRELSRAVEQSPASIIITDPEGKITYVNSKFTSMTGYAFAEAVGKNPRFLKSGETPPEVYAQLWQTILSGREWRGEFRNKKKNGGLYWESALISPILDEAGNITRFLAVEEDLTERKQAEAALKATETRYRRLFEAAQDGILILNGDTGQVVDANPFLKELLGYSQEEMLGRKLWEIGPFKGEAASKITFAELQHADRLRYEGLPLETKDGRRVEVEFISNAYLVDQQRLIQCNIRDMTGRKQVEEKLRREQALLTDLLDSIPDHIYFKDRQSRFIRINGAMARHFGLRDAAEAAGKTDFDMFSEEHARKAFDDEQQIMETGVPKIAFEEKETWPDGHVTWVSTTKIPLRGAEGRITGLVGISRDITANKALEEQLRQSQKMEAVGQLAGGVAHDFNNILAAQILQTAVLERDKNLSTEVRSGLEHIRQSAERAAALVRQLLLFSRRQMVQMRDLELNETVSNLTKMIQRVIGEDMQLQLRLHPEKLPLHGDSGMMEQVLVNLCVNARDAMPSGGKILLETSRAEFDEAAAAADPKTRPGSFVCLSVTDTGSGIAPEILPRIFEPFFTTKDVGKGTGLGLATVYGIVQQHQGWINVHSEVGRGTTFRIYLPRQTQPTSPGIIGVKAAAAVGGSETILLVEDESALRTMAGVALSRLGYRVLQAADGAAAQAVWKEHRAEISLLLTDLVMPGGLNGRDLAEQLLAESPQLKVVYTSGYSTHIATENLQLEEGVNFLPKPYALNRLTDIIRRRLDAR